MWVDPHLFQVQYWVKESRPEWHASPSWSKHSAVYRPEASQWVGRLLERFSNLITKAQAKVQHLVFYATRLSCSRVSASCQTVNRAITGNSGCSSNRPLQRQYSPSLQILFLRRGTLCGKHFPAELRNRRKATSLCVPMVMKWPLSTKENGFCSIHHVGNSPLTEWGAFDHDLIPGRSWNG